MKLLALDTSSVACSVALCDGDRVVERHEEQAREHTRLLMPMINAVLADARLTVADTPSTAFSDPVTAAMVLLNCTKGASVT